MFFVVVAFLPVSIFAAAKTWTGSAGSAWGDANNWSPAGIPAAADAVTVNSGGTQPVISSETVSITSLAVSSGATLTISGGSLSVQSGTLTIAGTINQSAGTFLTNIAFTLSSGAALNMSGSGLLHLGTSTASNPTVSFTVAANTSVTQSGGTIKVLDISVASGSPAGNYSQSAGTLEIYRDYKSGGVFNSTGGNINFSGNATTPTFTSGTNQFFNVTVASGVSPKFDAAASSAFSVAGDFYYNSLTAIGVNSTITFNGSGAQSVYTVVATSSSAFGNITINKTSGTATLLANIRLAGNLTISNGTLDLDVNAANRLTAGGTLSVSATGKLKLGANTGGQTGSNFPTNFSTVTLTTGSTIDYSGSSSITQTIYSGVTYSNLTLTNSTGSGSATKNTTANITVNANLTINSGAILTPGAAFTVGGTGTLTGTGTAQVTRTTATADFLTQYTITNKAITNATIDYNATTSQTINAVNYGNLSISGARTTNNVILASSGTIGISGTLTTAATFTTGSYTVTGSSVTFNGITTQYCPAFTFNNITISKTAGDVVLTGSITVAGTLTFSSGKISTGINAVICTAGTISGAGQLTGWVNGSLQRSFSSGALSKTFDVGGSLYYCPATVTFASVASGGNINVTGTDGTHPNVVSNGFTISNSIPFYWRLTNAGSVAFTSYTLSITWNSALNYSSYSAALVKTGKYTSSTWSVPTATGTPSTTNVQATGITTMGDFIAGEMCDVNAGFTYPSSPYCTNGGNAVITLNSGSTAGAFTATPTGLSISSSTGSITLGSSTAGTYTVTNTATGTGGCTAASSAIISISQAPVATISYASSPYCSGAGTAAVALTGTSGGTFSNGTGLTIDGSSGSVTLASSSIGTHTVTYTVAAANGCAAFTTTGSITVYTTPTASISYPSSPYCSSVGIVTVTRTGSTGGTYSSVAGLVLDASTGDINTSTSTAGTYTVYSTVSNSCPVTVSTNVTIQKAASATISYIGVPFCNKTGTASVTLTGDAGGTFSSTTGLVLNSSTGSVNTGTSTAGSYTVKYTIPASGACGQFQTTAPFVLTDVRVWTGLTNSNWGDPTNWDCQSVPSKITDVYVPSNIFNFPILSSNIEIKNLTLESSALLTVFNVTLKIRGTVTTYGGKINALSGKVEFSGTTPQSIPADLFIANTIKNLSSSNPSTVTLAGPLKVMNQFSFSTINSGVGGFVNNCVFNTGGHLTLASDSTYNGGISDLTNGGISPDNAVVGDVTVERFVRSKRCYRFLSAPVNSTGTIQDCWQEGSMNSGYWANVNPNPGYGTNITGAGANINGFDWTQTNNPSMWSWDNATQGWVPLSNTYGKFKAGTGYRIIVRGDRSVDMSTNTPPSTVTILRSKGTVISGTVVMAKAGGGGTAGMPELASTIGNYTLVGNPYPNGILWSSIVKNDIASTVYIFDPTIAGINGKGGFIAYNPSTGSNVPSNIDNNLQSGQAFFVQTTGPNPSLTFKETHKTSIFRYVFRETTKPKLSIQLLNPSMVNTSDFLDGSLVVYSDEFNNTIGDEDSYKFTNPDENIGIVRDGKVLSIDGRRTITQTDTIPLKLWKYTGNNYSFKIKMTDFAPDVEAYLEDRYKNTSTRLATGDSIYIPFSLTADSASFDPERFRIIFRKAGSLPLSEIEMNAYPKGRKVEINWRSVAETGMSSYEVERSITGQSFEKIRTEKAAGNTGADAHYSTIDNEPNELNFYRIKAISKAGDIKYSNVVKVALPNLNNNNLIITSNPVVNNTITFKTTGVEPGKYVLNLYNLVGQAVYTTGVVLTEGSANYTVELKNKLAHSLYKLVLSNGDKSFVTELMMQ